MDFTWPIEPPPKSTPGQLFGAQGKHTGLDMGTLGDIVLAAAAGSVKTSAATGDSRGRIIVLDHGEDADGTAWETYYFHLDSTKVVKGQLVVAGEPIAVAGQSGLPNPWPHLHFEVHRNGVAVDPLKVLVESVAAGAGGRLATVVALAGLVWLVMR